jgi:hypothetical protein
MSLTIPPVQTAHAQSQETQQAPPPPKPAATQSIVPQDKVSISDSAKQAAAGNTKPAAGDANHDGDSH